MSVGYADFNYYEQVYGGTNVSLANYDSFNRDASAFIDYITFNRIKKLDDVPDEVKLAVCSVIDKMYSVTDGTGNEPTQLKSSESVGDYQVSYQSSNQSQTTLTNQFKSMYYQTAKMYLEHTGLLYRGIYPC